MGVNEVVGEGVIVKVTEGVPERSGVDVGERVLVGVKVEVPVGVIIAIWVEDNVAYTICVDVGSGVGVPSG